jgi:hypothetical protein
MTPIYKSGKVEPEVLWRRRQTCSRSCAKKLNNPSYSEETRKKVSATLKRMGHKPVHQGGNGKGPTEPQLKLWKALGPDWEMEYIQNIWMGVRDDTLPSHYKIDIADPVRMIAIEVDGFTHRSNRVKESDKRKDARLAALGWTVFRVSNKEAMRLSTISRSEDILHTLQTAC